MTYCNDARVLDAMELKELIEDDGGATNPTINRLVFIEVKSIGGKQGRLYPCLVTSWGEDESMTSPMREDGRNWLVFKCSVIQSKDGTFSLVPVTLHEVDLTTEKRIWDKPPTMMLTRSGQYTNGRLQ